MSQPHAVFLGLNLSLNQNFVLAEAENQFSFNYGRKYFLIIHALQLR